jgi:thiamine transporter
MENKRFKALFLGAVMLFAGLAGTLYALDAINASERLFQAERAFQSDLRAALEETDHAAADEFSELLSTILVRPVREYAEPLSASAIRMLCILGVSVLLFFVGGGMLITRVVTAERLARIQRNNISLLTFSALCIALATVLSQIRLYRMPYGGSVTAFSMLPIVLVGYWYGTRAGLAAGAVYGVVRLMLGAFVVHPIQFILDYPLAYAALGAFCLFKGKRFGLQISYLAGAAGRFLCNFAAGIVFFTENVPDGQHVWAFSAVYQLTYLLPEVIVTLTVISVPTVANAIEKLRLARLNV